MNSRIGPEHVRAKVVTAISTEPGVWAKARLADNLQVQRADVQRSVQYFCELGWLQPAVQTPTKGHTFEATRVFWEDFHDMVEGLDLSPNEQVIYEQALSGRASMESAAAGSLEAMQTRAQFLGGVAVLGEVHDLTREFGWFSGEHGWRSLVSIQVLEPVHS